MWTPLLTVLILLCWCCSCALEQCSLCRGSGRRLDSCFHPGGIEEKSRLRKAAVSEGGGTKFVVALSIGTYVTYV